MSRFQHHYPHGALSTTQEILDILNQAKEENININLYAVEQMGYITKYIITPKSEFSSNPLESLSNDPNFNQITLYATYNFIDKNKWLWNYILMGSYNIDDPTSNAHGVHRLFTHPLHAENYSQELKTDQIYIQEVKDHRKLVDELFKNDDFFNDYDYD